jgi:putative pyrroloquinoline-quinone binding quinoprotein
MNRSSRFPIAGLMVAAVIAGTAGTAGASERGQPHHDRGTVFVTERQLGSVTAFDATTGAALWTSPTGPTPIGVTRPSGTHKVYTSDEGANQMSVFDEESGTLLGTIPMGLMPHHLMADRSGRRIYVGEFGQNTVGVIDTSTDSAIAHWVANPLSTARTHSVFVTRNGRYVYAANTRANRAEIGDVAKLDARTGALLCNTIVGADPSEILVTRDGKIGYVSVRRENTIRELDLSGPCPVLTGREALIGTQPDTLQLTRDKTLVVTLRGTPAQISLLDTRTFAVRIVNIPGHTTTGHHWLSADTRYSFVAVESPGGLAVVDNVTATVVADYAYPTLGGSRPHGVFFIRDDPR